MEGIRTKKNMLISLTDKDRENLSQNKTSTGKIFVRKAAGAETSRNYDLEIFIQPEIHIANVEAVNDSMNVEYYGGIDGVIEFDHTNSKATIRICDQVDLTNMIPRKELDLGMGYKTVFWNTEDGINMKNF